MSKDWPADMAAMHAKFGTNEIVRKFDKEKLTAFLEFRIKMMEEEMGEIRDARSAEEIVDGIIDLCVFAIGTLDAFEVDSHWAWNRVFDANMLKSVGVKPGRPNPLGLPDLIKPEGWVSPTHTNNLGLLEKIDAPKPA